MNTKNLAVSMAMVLVVVSLLAFVNVTPIRGAEHQPGEFNASQDETHTVLLLVENTILQQLGTAYAAFKGDLAREGFTVFEEAITSSTQPPEIKTIIQGYWSDPYHTLDGAILIGNLKAPYFIAKTGDFSNPEALEVWLSLDATDMYYEDLNGSWDHLTVDEFHNIAANPPPEVVELYEYESCTTFENEYLVSLDKEREWDYQSIADKGQYSIEIWVARIMGHNLSIPGKSEADILNDYFAWSHTFRTGEQAISSTGFMLNAGSGYNDQGMDYSTVFTEVIQGENVTKAAYLTHLQRPSGSKLVYLSAHSSPKGHALSDEFLSASEILSISKNSVFYILNACSACRWDEFISAPTDPNYMGGLYVFDKSHTNGDFGLGAMCTTGVGGFNNLAFFTEYYSSHPGSNYGEMFRYWFNQNLQINFSPHNYVFLGDPTIGPDTPVWSVYIPMVFKNN